MAVQGSLCLPQINPKAVVEQLALTFIPPASNIMVIIFLLCVGDCPCTVAPHDIMAPTPGLIKRLAFVFVFTRPLTLKALASAAHILFLDMVAPLHLLKVVETPSYRA